MSNSDRGFTDGDIPPLAGRRFVITGANSGLGFETARQLAAHGGRVVLACRDAKRGAAALEALGPFVGTGGDARLELLDLGDLASIRDFAKRELASDEPLHVLVNNAGVMAIPERKTADGFEMTMGVNHLGHFALTALLFPKLAASDSGRVVNVSSQYHRAGELALMDDLFLEKRGYHRWVIYQQSKLANLLFHYELARRIDKRGVKVLALAAHPGYAATELQGRGAQMGGPRWEGLMMSIGNTLFAQSVRGGAWPQERAATATDARNGDYYGPSGIGQLRGPAVRVESAARARDEEAARRLWETSERLTGTTFAI